MLHVVIRMCFFADFNKIYIFYNIYKFALVYPPSFGAFFIQDTTGASVRSAGTTFDKYSEFYLCLLHAVGGTVLYRIQTTGN